ncbi:hypothetical protein Tco_0491757 [Tanacetum coccineum]
MEDTVGDDDVTASKKQVTDNKEIQPADLDIKSPSKSDMGLMLPKPHMYNLKPKFVCGMKMAFDPAKSPYYKVVHAIGIGDDNDVASI